eukprot:SAG22_NODE_202_length_15324_cov_7.802627_12_plen_195_part_00
MKPWFAGLVVAVDRTGLKVQEIERLAEELGLRTAANPGCIRTHFGDARKLMTAPAAAGAAGGGVGDSPAGGLRTEQSGAAAAAAGGGGTDQTRYPPESFDRILLDPSCSALGLRPRLRHTASPAELAGYAKLQRLLFRWAVKLLRPGGAVVYSTCTFNPLENERNVAAFLAAFPGACRPRTNHPTTQNLLQNAD